MRPKIIKTPEFDSWMEQQNSKDYSIIYSRLYRIEENGHFGDCKNLGNGLSELRWKNGRRVYYTLISKFFIVMLNGGMKNAQKKDIKKASQIIKRYTNNSI